ncbi:Nicotinamide riboside kinase 1 family protein [Acanthamoeba castellanii str. Neff]|uniref:Nicotinamide riboside kinase 1 family protein n=1 Tax=Acanthamoeba castellanii (strain ATCC 30010 / Neff) TaxID=1257118 RepID=L8GDW0_ACACF|nr:Nicotinamide riboside kinase 1 family protein [Acanthamoeba castellanii str. Neff]ELR11212.1 Nicotinamide riboside kinase 1 family protein [Acanthamoeba castellanii str. Neff]
MAFFRELLLSLVEDEPQLQRRFLDVTANGSGGEDGVEIATLPFLLHILSVDEKRERLMAARVATAIRQDEDGGDDGEAQGDSILHYAARRGYTFWCDALLRRDALLDEPNSAQAFPPLFYGAALTVGSLHAVDVARDFSRAEIVDYLETYLATSGVKPGQSQALVTIPGAADGPATAPGHKRVLTIGICGATSSGKSTLVKRLVKHFNIASYVRFDNFWKSYNELPREQGYVHGECPEALRMDEFVAYLRAAQHRSEEDWTETSEPFIFVDGFLLFCDVKYLPLYDIKIFINVSKEKCKERRFGRDPGTSEDYFERIIWPSYCQWNSHPLGVYEQRRLASDHGAGIAPKEQHAVEHDGILFINGEADVDEVFRSALDHINSRRQAHLTSST